jgi:MFS transporter, OFA family, oxalate/formate antiporter
LNEEINLGVKAATQCGGNRAMGFSDAVARFPPHPSFCGWRVVAGAFITSMVGFGAIYSYGAFAKTLADTFELSSASTSMIIALSIGTTFFVSALSGLLSDRIGPRQLAVAGMLITGLGLLLAAEATTALQVYLCYGVLLGLGTGLAYVPASAAVQRWFITWRGLASGIAAAGVGVGTILVQPLTRLLSSFGDWRFTFMICGIGAAVMGTVGALLLSASHCCRMAGSPPAPNPVCHCSLAPHCAKQHVHPPLRGSIVASC